MWSNMEGNQGDASMKEKQAHLANGGGPTVHVNPDIAFILPDMLRVAPIIFSSNISEEVINERRKAVFNNSSIFEKTLRGCNDDCSQPGNSFGADTSHINEMFMDPISVTENCEQVTAKRSIYTGSMEHELNDTVTVPKKKTKTVQLQNIDKSIQMKLKLERIRQLIKQEGELAELKLQHEKPGN
ncbi:uncharacterized protein LOC143371228 isoform X2 [Andrena cerasifolii]|uniref:uncharacterized protein LOC143371228 isoform X2 n=1 Tax=Andrena cerasifolii TaxID=2819439 RepID=UPI0040378A1A